MDSWYRHGLISLSPRLCKYFNLFDFWSVVQLLLGKKKFYRYRGRNEKQVFFSLNEWNALLPFQERGNGESWWNLMCAYCLISVSHPVELRFVLPLHTQSTLIFFLFLCDVCGFQSWNMKKQIYGGCWAQQIKLTVMYESIIAWWSLRSAAGRLLLHLALVRIC